MNRIQDTGPLKLVDGDPQAKAAAGCLSEKRDDGFDQAARQPIIGGLSDDAGPLVLKAACVFLRRDRAGIEKYAMGRVQFGFGLDVDGDRRTIL
jgi:hypothetical protein